MDFAHVEKVSRSQVDWKGKWEHTYPSLITVLVAHQGTVVSFLAEWRNGSCREVEEASRADAGSMGRCEWVAPAEA